MVETFTKGEAFYNLKDPHEKLVRHSDYAALEAKLAERVKVKALEWARGWMNAEAQTEIGKYTITYRRDGSFEWGIGILKVWASSWDAAKSAAQADFDRRILSALEATPPAPKVVHITHTLSDEARKQLADIDQAQRHAAQDAGSFIVGSTTPTAPKVTGLDEWEGEITDTSERVSADRNRQARITAAQEAGE